MILFGHSMGSMIAQAYVQRYGAGLAGYVLSGCPGAMDGADEVEAGLKAAVDGGMADQPVDMLGSFNAAFEPARTKFDWLSRDPAEVDAYVNDPMCGDGMPLTFGFVNELFAVSAPAMEATGIASIPKMPVLMITGENDPAAGMAANARRAREEVAGRRARRHRPLLPRCAPRTPERDEPRRGDGRRHRLDGRDLRSVNNARP